METEAQYTQRERRELFAKLREVETAPLAERREARENWAQALKEPTLVAERVKWIFNGSYGKGAYDLAREIAANKRANREARLGILIAALEWRCPGNFARQAWTELSPNAQEAVNAAIHQAMQEALKE